ncbi:cytochrome C [Sulfurimonas sp.]
MKKITSLFLTTFLAVAVFVPNAAADANRGKMLYMKKVKNSCKKDGLKNGGIFAAKHNRRDWASLKESGKIQNEWSEICPHATKKIKKFRAKDIKNLYDFVWKYASDGEVPSCG